ncbi:MAG: VOC family protein [Synechococcus sp.]
MPEDSVPKARIEQARYVLAVLDLASSANYYRDVLGFDIREIGDPGWRFFVKDNWRVTAQMPLLPPS